MENETAGVANAIDNSQFSTLNSPLIPPGYKQTEVGVIPEDWEVCRLGEGIKLSSGHHVLARHCNTDGDGVAYITGPADFPNGVIQHTKCTTMPGTICSADDILVTVKGSGAGTIVLSNGAYCISRQLMAVRVHSWSTNYIYFSLLRDALLFGAAATGLIPGLSRSDILNKAVPLPPTKAEQEAIAEALSNADALIESLEQLLAKKRQLKQGAMQELLTGKKRLPGFSGEWEVKRLGEICEIAMGRTPPRLNPEFWGRGHPWLSIADLRAKLVTESKEEITALAAAEMQVIPKGTLLMSFKLSIGRLCFAGCDLYTNEAICSFNKLRANADFLYYVLGRADFSLYGKQAVKGYTLNSESLRLVEVHLPSEAEQTAIAAILSDMDAEIAALEAKLAKARSLKQGMMQELLTGRIRLPVDGRRATE